VKGWAVPVVDGQVVWPSDRLADADEQHVVDTMLLEAQPESK
jgi:hypothetical protein